MESEIIEIPSMNLSPDSGEGCFTSDDEPDFAGLWDLGKLFAHLETFYSEAYLRQLRWELRRLSSDSPITFVVQPVCAGGSGKSPSSAEPVAYSSSTSSGLASTSRTLTRPSTAKAVYFRRHFPCWRLRTR